MDLCYNTQNSKPQLFYYFQTIDYTLLFNYLQFYYSVSQYLLYILDSLHLSIPAQSLPNGEAAIQHPGFAGIQTAYPGVGKCSSLRIFLLPCYLFEMY